MNTQPEALRLAKIIEGGWTNKYGREAAAELRRLHKENEELKERIKLLEREVAYAENGYNHLKEIK